jgi:hypothetical protein
VHINLCWCIVHLIFTSYVQCNNSSLIISYWCETCYNNCFSIAYFNTFMIITSFWWFFFLRFSLSYLKKKSLNSYIWGGKTKYQVILHYFMDTTPLSFLGQVVNSIIKLIFLKLSILWVRSLILRKIKIYWKKSNYCWNGTGWAVQIKLISGWEFLIIVGPSSLPFVHGSQINKIINK